MSWSDAAARVNAAQLRKFGETIIYQAAGAGAASAIAMTGVWSDSEPLSVWLRASDLPGIRIGKNDVFRRGSDTYKVVEPLPRAIDGGLTILLRHVEHAPNS